MTTPAATAPARAPEAGTPAGRPRVRLAMLGLGRVGSALASLIDEQPALRRRFSINGALVRDPRRPRGSAAAEIALTTDGVTLLAPHADVVIEALGGIEPARSLALAAFERGLAVVTANKSLLAAHGDELIEAAAATGVPFRYEASVIAGVPFLGMLAGRPLAGDIVALGGIVNGTSNYILSTMADGRATFDAALAGAQARGYAEPDPANDVRGVDAVEKLCVLLRHFGGWSVRPAAIETSGIDALVAQDLEHARWFGGAIRPIVFADWRTGEPRAFAGPAFVDGRHPFARVDGVTNAVALQSRWCGDLLFSGPGAGPAVTAATLLDDASEVAHQAPVTTPAPARPPAACGAPTTGWFVRLSAPRLRDAAEFGRLLDAHGVSVHRASALDTRTGIERQWLLIRPCARASIDRAIAALADASCQAYALRTIG